MTFLAKPRLRINSATLISWTKGFCSSGVVGEDVVKLLEEALARRGDINCEIVAVVNDTVGTLMSCAFDDHSCQGSALGWVFSGFSTKTKNGCFLA